MGILGFGKDIISGSNFMTNFSRRGPKFADPMAFNRMKSPCYPAYMRPDYSFIYIIDMQVLLLTHRLPATCTSNAFISTVQAIPAMTAHSLI